ncbi:hypothetical protein GWO43_06245 [candidate division KSB1 bacterium]|nr:hypothetical protein [candidate division KSB1 bacterium]NIR72374.1 hypothetical protein [candidate division KSB1 bacterium]NIS23560.1 hypothetical protein [candidate division KSB1 bacterium]NIT70489.1 hypothetical protein [candidate division KSB1 bacterium]NIU24194.1 hypothetical protein [candidate division KSB1 bacterium]
MAEITIDEKRLQELIDSAVQKHLKESMEDMEEVRRSPAAAVVRLETRFDALEKNVATKADLSELRTELSERIGTLEKGLGERMAKLETGQKLMFTIFLSLFGAIIAMLVKLVFFP